MLKKILIQKKSSILSNWIELIFDSYAHETSKFLKTQKNQFSNPVGYTISFNAERIFDELVSSQNLEDIKSYLDSAWTFMIIRGFILLTILFFFAPYIATFFNTPESIPIIRVIGLGILIQASTNVGGIYFRKELEFNKQFIFQLSGTLADVIIAVTAGSV